jgi:hypothetical protein
MAGEGGAAAGVFAVADGGESAATSPLTHTPARFTHKLRPFASRLPDYPVSILVRNRALHPQTGAFTAVSRSRYLASAAACLAAAVLVIVFLEGGDDRDQASDVATTNTTAPPSEAVPVTDTSATPVVSPSSIDERTPAQRQVDQAAAAAGLGELNGYSSPHQAVEEACGEMRDDASGKTAAEWLSLALNFHSGEPEPYRDRLYRIGFPLLCPEHVATLDAVLGGTAPVGDGSYQVGAAHNRVVPGQWRTTDAVADCYWERTSPNGDILDNQFVTHAAARVTITIRPSDGSFTTRGCGMWELVR